MNAVRREGVGPFSGLSLETAWGGKGGYLPHILSLIILRLVFVFPGIVVGKQGFVDCVCCIGEAYCIAFS
jgi:hypothetical protein